MRYKPLITNYYHKNKQIVLHISECTANISKFAKE